MKFCLGYGVALRCTVGLMSLACAAPPPRSRLPDSEPSPSNAAQPSPASASTPAEDTATVPPLALPAQPTQIDPDSIWGQGAALNREVSLLRVRAQRRVLGDVPLIEDEHGRPVTLTPVATDSQGKPLWVNGNTLGRFVPLENEPAMEPFHRALEELATGRDQDGKLRIVIYGASHTQGDLYTGYLRNYLQSRFGNGGAGFMQLARLNQFYRTLDFKVDSEGFRIEHAQKKEPLADGRYGLFGAAAVGNYPSAHARVYPVNNSDLQIAAARYTLYYDAGPRAGDLKLSIDEQKPILLPGRVEQPTARYYPFELGLGWHEIEVRPAGNGPVRLFGISIERPTPGIVIDAMGINGTRAANLLKWDADAWHEQLLTRDPQLLVLAYGTNEVTDEGEPIEVYTRRLREVLARLRSFLPAVSCLLVGPGDFPRALGDVWQTRPRVRQINEIQRKLAADAGCSFWDLFAFMGGENSMHRWATAKPALGSPDHIHFTARGYVRMGMGLADALLRGYDRKHLRPD